MFKKTQQSDDVAALDLRVAELERAVRRLQVAGTVQVPDYTPARRAGIPCTVKIIELSQAEQAEEAARRGF